MNLSDRSRARAALEQARQALSAKHTAEARQLAAEAAALDPELEEAWLILAAFSPPDESITYLKRALQINPDSRRARLGLDWAVQRLQKNAAKAETPAAPAESLVAAPVPAAPAPVLVEATHPVSVRPAAARPHRTHGNLWLAVGLLAVLGVMLLFIAPFSNKVKAYYSSQIRPVEALYKPPLTPTRTFTSTLTPTIIPTITFTLTSSPSATLTERPSPSNTPRPTRKRTAKSTRTQRPILPNPTPPPTIAAPVEAYQPPPAAAGEGHWVDVDLTNQTAAAYDGDELVRTFVVSTGTYQHPTVTGEFYIYVKHRYADMRGPGYYLPDVPYVMYFYKGYGLHGTYWHNNFGTPMSHGCVNFTIDDAAWLFDFTSIGTLINVHY